MLLPYDYAYSAAGGKSMQQCSTLHGDSRTTYSTAKEPHVEALAPAAMAQPTRFYASSRPLDVFNDDAFFDNEAPMTSHAPMPNPTKPMRRPWAIQLPMSFLNQQSLTAPNFHLTRPRPRGRR
ncbi:uncharacterized protein TrAFT101_001796 [Trichoderma asperellum]|uniref:uncharacterized protein n=1 Tax=Trichoderma asperellum TaxID=101201 RepID=UPI00331B6FA2|nr:hypothetical protein TrAFT101_001796 [Trichoderma asperellum]